MIIFDSNKSNNWTGKGFVLNRNIIVARKNANFRSKIAIGKGEYSLRVYAKNRTGSSPIFYKIVTERNKIILSGKILFSKNWSEERINFEIQKNMGMGYITFYRESSSYGSIEIGRVILEKEHLVNLNKDASKSMKIYNDLENKSHINKFLNRNITFVIPYSIYGGAEIYLETIINNINSELFKINMLYIKDNPIRLSIHNKSVTHKVVKSYKNFKNFILNNKTDYIIYYNSLNAYKWIKSSLNEANFVPKVIEIYHSDFKWSDSLSSINFREKVDTAFVISKNFLKDVPGIKNIVHLPVPIDVDKFTIRDVPKNKILNINNNNKNIGTVARLSAEKNIDYALSLAKKMPNYNFLIFGKGPLESELKNRILKENISNAYILGFKKDIYRYYCYFDAFLLPSKMEGTPISILEAMSSGIPVFANNVGEISSIIKDEETGFFLKDNLDNNVELIEKNIFNLEVINSARKYVEDFHKKELISSKFINSLIDLKNNFKKRNNENILPGEYI